MAGRQSTLTEDSLQSCLAAFRQVAAIRDEAEALSATDNVVAQIVRGMREAGLLPGVTDAGSHHSGSEFDDWQIRSAEAQLDQINRTAARLEAALAVPEGLQPWDAVGLRGAVERLDEYVDAKVRQRLAGQLNRTRQRAHDVADRVEVACEGMAVRRAATQVLHNASSVTSILTAVDDAIVGLRSHGALTDELAQVAREAMVRAARFRCDKKLGEAEVAMAGGSDKRAEKLRREASTMLAQDWARAFPGEEPPAI